MCSARCFSRRNVDICAALCFLLPTDSVVTEPCDVTPAHTDIWVGRLVFFLKKNKNKQPINQKDQKPGIPVLLHSLPLTEDELRVLGRCLCEAVFKATSWCSFTWVRFVSCVPQGLAPTRILQGVKVMAKWKHHLPRCLQHTLPLRAPPGSALLVTCHQKLG